MGRHFSVLYKELLSLLIVLTDLQGEFSERTLHKDFDIILAIRLVSP